LAGPHHATDGEDDENDHAGEEKAHKERLLALCNQIDHQRERETVNDAGEDAPVTRARPKPNQSVGYEACPYGGERPEIDPRVGHETGRSAERCHPAQEERRGMVENRAVGADPIG
jgi:hypothetical protein